MGAHDVRNVSFDGGSWKIRLGARAIPLLKLADSKEEVKNEKIRLIGMMVATVTTPGVYEANDFEAEMLTTVYKTMFLPCMPLHGWTLFEFPITCQARHPLLGSPYTQVRDRCRVRSKDGGGIEATEKGSITKIGFSCIQIFDKGDDGKFKSMALNPELPAPSTAAFLL